MSTTKVAPLSAMSHFSGSMTSVTSAVSSTDGGSSDAANVKKILNFQSMNQNKNRFDCRNLFKGTPLTAAGKRKQMAKIMILILVPIAALAGVTVNDLATVSKENILKKEVRKVMKFGVEASLLIHKLQRERDMTALFMTSGSSETRMIMTDRYPDTDRAIIDLSLWPTDTGYDVEFTSKMHYQSELAKHRRELNRLASDLYSEVRYYTKMISVFVNWIYSAIQQSKDGALWRTMVAYQLLLVSKEDLGLERTLGGIFFTRGSFVNYDDFLWYLDRHFVSKNNFNAADLYSEAVMKIYKKEAKRYNPKFQEHIDYMREELVRNNNSYGPSLERSTYWFDNITMRMDIYFSIQLQLAKLITVKLADAVRQDTSNVSIGISLFCLTIIVCPIIIISIQAIMSDVQKYAFTLAEQTKNLNQERKRTDNLLYQMLPKPVAEQLKRKKNVPAESYEQSTVYFSDIVGFTSLAADCAPMQVVGMLNMLYVCFDDRIEKYEVYKVETIGDAYMVVSGVPIRNGNRHPIEICTMALDLLHHVSHMDVPHTGRKMILRAGVHTGPCVAGVVGSKMPRYCLFGDTVNTASRMESFSEGNGIQISETTRNSLVSEPAFKTQRRGEINVKGKGPMVTYWLLGKDGLEDTFVCMPHCSAALEKRNLAQILPQDNPTEMH